MTKHKFIILTTACMASLFCANASICCSNNVGSFRYSSCNNAGGGGVSLLKNMHNLDNLLIKYQKYLLRGMLLMILKTYCISLILCKIMMKNYN